MATPPLDTLWGGVSSPSPMSVWGHVRRVCVQGVVTEQSGRARLAVRPRQQAGSDFVEALAHGLGLLNCWQSNEVWLTNSELAYRSGLTRSTVSRLTAVLFDLGYLSRDPDQGNRLRLTASTLNLGFGTTLTATAVSRVRPALAKLASALDVYVALGIRRDDKVQILENVASPLHPDAVAMDVGGLLPICRSASGLAAMSVLSERDVSPLICRLRSHYGKRWENIRQHMDWKKLEYSRTGYCTSVATLSQHVGAIAVPIVTARSKDTFVLACGMRAQEFYAARIEKTIAPLLLDAAKLLTPVLH